MRQLAGATADDDDEIGDARQLVARLAQRLAQDVQRGGVVLGVLGKSGLAVAVGATVSPETVSVLVLAHQAESAMDGLDRNAELRLAHSYQPPNRVPGWDLNIIL